MISRGNEASGKMEDNQRAVASWKSKEERVVSSIKSQTEADEKVAFDLSSRCKYLLLGAE